MKELKTVDIKGKPYVTVAERVKAFRNTHGFKYSIQTEIMSIDEKQVIMKAIISDGTRILSTGYAMEEKGSSFINKGSHIENCETSAVGRALAFFGIGISAEIASADEVVTNDLNTPIEDGQRNLIENMIHSSTLDEKIKTKIESEIDSMNYSRAEDCIEYLSEHQKESENATQKEIQKQLDKRLARDE